MCCFTNVQECWRNFPQVLEINLNRYSGKVGKRTKQKIKREHKRHRMRATISSLMSHPLAPHVTVCSSYYTDQFLLASLSKLAVSTPGRTQIQSASLLTGLGIVTVSYTLGRYAGDQNSRGWCYEPQGRSSTKQAIILSRSAALSVSAQAPRE